MENTDRFYAIECLFEFDHKKQISMQELNIGNRITFGLAHRVGKARPAEIYGEYLTTRVLKGNRQCVKAGSAASDQDFRVRQLGDCRKGNFLAINSENVVCLPIVKLNRRG